TGDMRVGEPPEKTHLRGNLPFVRELLKRIAFGAVADDHQFNWAILLLEQTRSFQEQPKSFGRNNAAQKNEHWDWAAGKGPHQRWRQRDHGERFRLEAI